MPRLDIQQRRFLREQLRNARADALGDAEAFLTLIAAIERVGGLLNRTGNGLADFEGDLGAIAVAAPSAGLPGPHASPPFDGLYGLVRRGRNEALHSGAFARHLVRHCVQLALLLEEGLMAGATLVEDFMVVDPVQAYPWQPVGYARHQMLLHSFSFLPISVDQTWHLLSDHAVALYLSRCQSTGARRTALGRELQEAVTDGLELVPAVTLPPGAAAAGALEASDGRPVLVVSESGHLVGILTPFDLL